MKIERKSISSISDESFIENYYQLDTPIILTGVQSLSQELCTPEYIKNRFWKESQKKFGWYAAALPDENDDIKVPSIFRTLSESSQNKTSDAPMRLWVQPKGNKTPWHYDAGGCHGFNLQLEGRKHWFIVSPDTPLPQVPMMNINAVNIDFVPDQNKVTCYECITQPGEMIFLPRGWAHTVECLEEVNINLNWLLYPMQPNLDTVIGRRECEVIKLISLFVNTEGEGHELTNNYIKNISSSAAILRLGKELLNLPKTLYRTPKLIPAIKKYLGNSLNT